MEWAALLGLLCVVAESRGQSYPTRPPSRPFLSTQSTFQSYYQTTPAAPTPSPVTRPTRYGSATSSTPRSTTLGNHLEDNLSFPDCGKRWVPPAALITNPLPTYQGEFPWHAAIFIRFSGSELPRYACGGSLITKRAVITAGHCVVTDFSGVLRQMDDITVYLGKYLRNEGWNEDRGVQNFTPHKILLHPDYNKDNLTSDIAIIFFGRDAKLSNMVTAVCLWNHDINVDLLVGQYGMVAGWGLVDIDRNMNSPNVLQKASFPVRSFEVCSRSKPDFFPPILARNNTYCAGYTNGTSACVGDSGGGMTFERNNRWYLRGVVSIGVPLERDPTLCNPKYYTIYSDVAKFLEWIGQNVEGISIIEPRFGTSSTRGVG